MDGDRTEDRKGRIENGWSNLLDYLLIGCLIMTIFIYSSVRTLMNELIIVRTLSARSYSDYACTSTAIDEKFLLVFFFLMKYRNVSAAGYQSMV